MHRILGCVFYHVNFFMLSVEDHTFASFLKRPEDEAKSIKSLHFGVLHTLPRTLVARTDVEVKQMLAVRVLFVKRPMHS